MIEVGPDQFIKHLQKSMRTFLDARRQIDLRNFTVGKQSNFIDVQISQKRVIYCFPAQVQSVAIDIACCIGVDIPVSIWRYKENSTGYIFKRLPINFKVIDFVPNLKDQIMRFVNIRMQMHRPNNRRNDYGVFFHVMPNDCCKREETVDEDPYN